MTASRYSYIFFPGSLIDRTVVSHGQEGVSVPVVVVGLASLSFLLSLFSFLYIWLVCCPIGIYRNLKTCLQLSEEKQAG